MEDLPGNEESLWSTPLEESDLEDAFDEAEAGFTDAEMASCIKVRRRTGLVNDAFCSANLTLVSRLHPTFSTDASLQTLFIRLSSALKCTTTAFLDSMLTLHPTWAGHSGIFAAGHHSAQWQHSIVQLLSLQAAAGGSARHRQPRV